MGTRCGATGWKPVAGVDPHGMNPLAVKVMAEAGVDIAGQHSKHVNDLSAVSFDTSSRSATTPPKRVRCSPAG